MGLVIKKVLNTSVVLCVNDDQQELIVLGKGIGYGKKAGAKIDSDDVNQVFVPVTSPEIQQMEEMLTNVSPEIVEVTRKIVQKATKVFDNSLNKSLSFSLMDHINFSLDRLKEGITFKNKLYWDVQSYYPEEFKIGEWAVSLINQELNVELPREEAASIAFHIINAESKSNDADSMEVTKIISSLMSIINLHNEGRLDPSSINYQRLLTHIKFFAQRILRGQQLDSDDDAMYQMVVNSYPRATKVAIKIMEFLEKKYRIKITDEEVTYLIVHIQRNLIHD
ncbi:PRD domain-containing protein [Lactobacillus sp. LL6]|uniref:BglG family transcription antiterminator LicT n=1 Tax=Lactobacillus sp. LL6 TaxID=2596827 RepID=UPI00118677A5|nr:PRD domain-containing protein [Lactobacillus sp. LL6]TSO25430.1 PRD domain-containing protein [Lactobacillus sp. LL6]